LAFGLAMFLEGLPYFVSPAGVRRYMLVLSKMSNRSLRFTGLTLMAAGLIVAYFATR